MNEEKKSQDQFEVVCDNLFRKYPVLCVEKLKVTIDDGAEAAQAAVLLSNQGKHREAAKSAVRTIAKAPLTLISGAALAATQMVVGVVVLPVSLVGMAMEKTQESASEPETRAAPAAE